jgi:hypothetical protein
MSKPERPLAPGQDWVMPADGPIGIRHKGGVTLIQALVRLCQVDGKAAVELVGPAKFSLRDERSRRRNLSARRNWLVESGRDAGVMDAARH